MYSRQALVSLGGGGEVDDVKTVGTLACLAVASSLKAVEPSCESVVRSVGNNAHNSRNVVHIIWCTVAKLYPCLRHGSI